MTLKEKLETIKGKKIAIWCEEDWQSMIILDNINTMSNNRLYSISSKKNILHYI